MGILEFWYTCLATNTSEELLVLVKKYDWHFKKLKPEAQSYLRHLYKIYKKKEEFLYK